MELEKEIIELKVQLGIALALANKAIDMAIQSKVEAQTQVKRIEIPEPSPAVKEFIEEMKDAKESDPVPQLREKLSPFTSSMFSISRNQAKGIDEIPAIGEDDDSDAIWESTVEGGV